MTDISYFRITEFFILRLDRSPKDNFGYLACFSHSLSIVRYRTHLLSMHAYR